MTEHAFAYPSVEAAHAFRSILNAFARPGQVKAFIPAVSASLPLWPTTAAVAVTLCDFQTDVWLSPLLGTEAVQNYLRFHTGAAITKNYAEADFVIASVDDAVLPLAQYARGTHEYPDRSATLILQVPGFAGTDTVELSGPGLETPARFSAEGLGVPFWQAMAENHALFPLGVDVVFVSPDAIAACPRSTAIHHRETA
jgi:alpha-D-ribose 1-methylphosphonate 5-triphosphate synthase subunit PhnH